MDKPKIIGYISDDYFRTRTIQEMQDKDDPVMTLLWEMVLDLVKSEKEEVKYKYKKDIVFENRFFDSFTAYQWHGETYEEKAKTIVNYIMKSCHLLVTKQIKLSDWVKAIIHDKMHQKESKLNVLGFVMALLRYLRAEIDKSTTGIDHTFTNLVRFIDDSIWNNYDTESLADKCFTYLYEERNISYYVSKDTYYYRKSQEGKQKDKTLKREAKETRTFGMGEKVTIAMLMKLESKLGINGLSTKERAEIYSAITGFSPDKIYNLLNGNFDLVKNYHLEDVERANKILDKMEIKRKLKCDR